MQPLPSFVYRHFRGVFPKLQDSSASAQRMLEGMRIRKHCLEDDQIAIERWSLGISRSHSAIPLEDNPVLAAAIPPSSGLSVRSKQLLSAIAVYVAGGVLGPNGLNIICCPSSLGHL